MFKGERYMAKGVQSDIPVILQIFMWDCILAVPEPDYQQIFRLSDFNGKQKVVHEQEVPEYKREYLLALLHLPQPSRYYLFHKGFFRNRRTSYKQHQENYTPERQ